MMLQLKRCVLIALCISNAPQCIAFVQTNEDEVMSDLGPGPNPGQETMALQTLLTRNTTNKTEETMDMLKQEIVVPLDQNSRAKKTKSAKKGAKTSKSSKSSKSSKASKASKKNQPPQNARFGPMRPWRLPPPTEVNLSQEERIIGGLSVPNGEYPWFARTTTGSDQRPSWYGCGGTLISPEYVLTAAHCVGQNMNGFQIGALCKSYTQGGNCGQDVEYIRIRNTRKHPDYNSKNQDNDFALSRLSGSSKIAPVNIDDGTLSKEYQDGKELWTIGFGNTEYGTNSSTQRLQHVKVSYVTNNSCCNQKDYKYPCRTLTSNMMCAADDGKDACQGDSGGPLYDKQKKVLVGVVSWGYGCAFSKYPGVYSRIAPQFEWIKSVVCNNHDQATLPTWCLNAPAVTSPGSTQGSVQAEASVSAAVSVPAEMSESLVATATNKPTPKPTAKPAPKPVSKTKSPKKRTV